jgi:hypothetical protein
MTCAVSARRSYATVIARRGPTDDCAAKSRQLFRRLIPEDEEDPQEASGTLFQPLVRRGYALF